MEGSSPCANCGWVARVIQLSGLILRTIYFRLMGAQAGREPGLCCVPKLLAPQIKTTTRRFVFLKDASFPDGSEHNPVKDFHASLFVSSAVAGLPARRQRSEQYFTCSQSRSHFLRQVNGNRQCAQVLLGSSYFLRILLMR